MRTGSGSMYKTLNPARASDPQTRARSPLAVVNACCDSWHVGPEEALGNRKDDWLRSHYPRPGQRYQRQKTSHQAA